MEPNNQTNMVNNASSRESNKLDGTNSGGETNGKIQVQAQPLTQAQSLEKIIFEFLRARGYNSTLQTFREESGIESGRPKINGSGSSVADFYANNGLKFDPDAYFSNYKGLRSWIQESLELYKPELNAFLYPLFIHSYLDLVSKSYYEKAFNFYNQNNEEHQPFHSDDLKALISIKTPEQVKESTLAKLYRENKYGLRISKVGFDLLIAYIQENEMITILRLINDYLSIITIAAIPGNGELADPIIGLTGHTNIQLGAYNGKKLSLGLPAPTQEFKNDVEQLLKDEDNLKKRKLSKSDASPFPSLLEQYREISTKRFNDGYSRDEFPLPPAKGVDVLRTIQEIKDITKQAKIVDDGKVTASICFYTLHNSNEGANNITISNNLHFMATAMHDSYIKLWSLKGEKLRNLKATFNATMVNEESSLDINREKSGSEFKLLIGHSGPVYGISFSPCSRYLISCSEDGTVRLWNTLTFICLACYRGHNYPIWDVDFSPNGTYFVTASHDRTARLWSTEHTSPLRIFTGHISDVDCVKFHPNGRYVATGSTDKTARLWDISTGSCVRVFTGHTSSIDRIAISNNGKLLATAGSDGYILVWDILTGRLTHTFEDPQELGTTYSLTFSYSDESLISGGNDYKIRIWDVQVPTNNPVPPLSQPAIADTTSKPSHPIKVFKTKRTSILHLKCTPRNLILAAGSFNP